jgi:hypothetical protein
VCAAKVKPSLSAAAPWAKDAAMSKDLSREERLAAQMRANLKRRKVQKKAIESQTDAHTGIESPDLSNGANRG